MFCYKNKCGRYIEADEIHRAFHYYSGKYWDIDKKQYIHFLNQIWGKEIVEACNVTECELITNNQKLLAIKCYRMRSNCSLSEARNYIENLCLENS